MRKIRPVPPSSSPAGIPQVRMRARPKPQIVFPEPAGRIMPAFKTRKGKVGYLIVCIAVFLKKPDCPKIHIHANLFGRETEFPLFKGAGIRGAFFNGEGVD